LEDEGSVAVSTAGDEKQPEELTEAEKNMTILEHLEELRSRLIIILIAVALATIASFFVARWAFDLLMGPAPDGFKPVAIRVMENFSTYIKVALFSGIIMALPVIVYQVAAFVSPGLTKDEKRWLYLLIPGVFLAFTAGITFGYFVVVPFALNYLLGSDFLIDIAEPMITVSDYIEFVVNLLLAMGFSFQLPIIVFFLSKIGIVNTRRLISYRKYAFVSAAVLAAIITPTPDPGTQVLVAVPLYVLFELGILLSRLA
jgi:sec-independent protein translocase protein TatC